MSVPFFAIGNDELDKAEPLSDFIKCPHCGMEHPVEYGEEVLDNGTKVPSKLIAFYKCGEKSYLCGINSKRI